MRQFILIELVDPGYGIDRACKIVEELLVEERLSAAIRVKNFRRIASRQTAVDRLWKSLAA